MRLGSTLLLLALCPLLHAEARLGLTADRLASVRKAIDDPAETRHAIYRALRASVDSPKQPDAAIDPFFSAIRASLLHKLTAEPRYAAQAYQHLRGAYTSDPAPHQADWPVRAAASLGLAYTWDWSAGASAADRAWLKDRITEMLAAWPAYQHEDLTPGLEGLSAHAACRGSELVLLLAAGEETRQSSRYRALKQDLLLHMQRFDEIGASSEGSVYPANGGTYLLRALLALRDVGDLELEAEAAKHAWWRQAMYSGAFSLRPDGAQRNWLMSGAGGPSIGDAGWASLLLAFVPRPNVPYFLWWYEHHAGAASPGDENLRYDPQADGRVWALLLYPEQTPMLDPTGVFPSGIRGTSGQVLIRNRWRNRSDIQIAIHAGAPLSSNLPGPSETFRLQVLAHGETWIGGPDTPANPGEASTLLVDGQAPASPTPTLSTIPTGAKTQGGSIRSAEFWLDGAYVVLDGGEAYRSLGVDQAERHVLVHFHPASDDLLLNTLDRVESTGLHSYTWQANLGEPGEKRRVARDRRLSPTLNPAFVFVGGGWPLCSVVGQPLDTREDLKIQYQDPVRATFSGTKAELRMQLTWHCSGGAFAPGSSAILESPRLIGEIVRTAEGGLTLKRGRTQIPAATEADSHKPIR